MPGFELVPVLGGAHDMVVWLYSEINLFAIAMMAIVLGSAVKFSFDNSLKKVMFVCSVFCAILANALDMVWSFAYYGVFGKAAALMLTVNFLYFVFFGLAGWFWFWYSKTLFGKAPQQSREYVLSTVPLVLLVMLLVVNCWNGCLFSFDEGGEHVRGPLFYLQQILTYGYVVVASFHTLFHAIRSRLRRDDMVMALSHAVPPLMTGILQIVFQSIPILSVGVMVSYLVTFICYLRLVVSVDPLTGVNNRRELLQRLDAQIGGLRRGRRLYLLFIDVDSFKQINDFFRHETGDRVLQTVARAITELCEKTGGICGRYGGDEFIVIQALDENEDVRVLAQALHGFVNKKCDKEKFRCHIGVSVGVAEYQPGVDTAETFITRADKRMYDAKKSAQKGDAAHTPPEHPSYIPRPTEWVAVGGALSRLILDHFDGAFLIGCEDGRLQPINDELVGKLRPYVAFDGTHYDVQAENLVQKMVCSNPTEMWHAMAGVRLDTVMCNLDAGGKYSTDITITREDATIAYKKFTYEYFDSKRAAIIFVCEDVTSLVNGEMDTLTGCYNFTGFHNRVRAWIAANPGKKYRIQRYNIDRFRDINGVYGYATGNKLLVDFAKYMRRNDTEDSFCAHLNGDHFVRFCSDDFMSPQECYERFTRDFENYNLHIPIEAHVGVYDLCESDCDTVTMSYKALIAMQSVKGDMTRHIAYYEHGMLGEEQKQRELLGDVNRALCKEEFEVWFQPQVDYKEKKILGAEALVRWRHPDRGLMMPAQFIPLLEKSNYIGLLDLYVMEKSCRFVRRMMDELPGKPVEISVNLSRMDLSDERFFTELERMVEQNNIPPSALHLEITESAYVNGGGELASVVDRLRAHGFSVEMDDFGAGYSSLNSLKDICVDKLKLDMKFLCQKRLEKRGQIILSAVVNMVHALGICLIAEGVETEEQAQMLLSFGCTQMQGYYFSRPVPGEQYERILKGEEHIPGFRW